MFAKNGQKPLVGRMVELIHVVGAWSVKALDIRGCGKLAMWWQAAPARLAEFKWPLGGGPD